MGYYEILKLLAFSAILTIVKSDTKCPDIFQRYSQQHTYCKPSNPSCNIKRTTVSAKDIEVILQVHNDYRNKIATGRENGLPTASNMMQMVWDNELAAVAQQHANQCKFEHDCSNCRRVMNFGVGQNLASEYVTGSPTIPEPNWQSAIKSWYDEVQHFTPNLVGSFLAPPPKNTYGHFSQAVWADSWKVGCGYTLYQEGNTYKKLYTCNYGPAGNTIQQSVYNSGAPCSNCPMNSCCGQTCGISTKYEGLCRITDDKGPTYKPTQQYIFYCDFQNQPDCDHYATGENKWLIYNTLSGSYVGIVLKGGEDSTLTFKTPIKPNSNAFCFVINYRKGPNVAGQEDISTVTETFTIPVNNFKVPQKLPSFGGEQSQQFSEFSMALSWSMETQYEVNFSVPPGKPDQFFEIKSVYATEGPCKQ